MKFIVEVETETQDYLLAALVNARISVTKMTEVTSVQFGAMKPCENRGKTLGYDDRWAVGAEDQKSCSSCGVALTQQGEGYSAKHVHPDSGDVPDYGKPLPAPADAKLVRYDGMENSCGKLFLGAFYADGQLVAAKEVEGQYHKSGKWSYTDRAVVVPEKALLLCISRSTHSHANRNRSLKYQGKEAFIGKLDELDRLPDAAQVSKQLGVEITAEQLEHIVLYRTALATRQRWAELKQLSSVRTF